MGEAIREHMADVFVRGAPEVATAYLARSAETLAACARVLGRDADAARYDALAAGARRAWAAEFVDAEGLVRPQTQATLVRALAFGLIPEGRREAAARQLADLVEAAGRHLTTGFLATPLILPTLADVGRLDLAYALLLQRSEPGWLVMVDRGSTTVWESFRSLSADGVARGSLNHYSLGAVISFLYEYVAGIRSEEPAYRRFRVAPRPGGGLTSAEAVHDCPYGRIESRWRIEGGSLRLAVRVPPGARAVVELPGGARHRVGPGRHSFGEACGA